MLQYLYGFIILTAIGILYEKYKQKYIPDEKLKDHELIMKFLLNGDGGNLAKKPILWIYTERSVNSRWWPSFYSRNTTHLNQPYLISCVETIIKHCASSFNICLIDNDSFHRLLPGWNIHLDRLGDPVKEHFSLLALTKVLHRYGGMLVPNSTIVMKDLLPVYNSALQTKSCFAVEGINRAKSATYVELFPMTKFMGCRQNSPVMKQFVTFLERKTRNDYTDQFEFLGEANQWLYQARLRDQLVLINCKFFGMVDKHCKLVDVDRLMSSTFIEFDEKDLYGVYLPSKEILKRTSVQWFTRLSQLQLRQCDAVAAKYLLIAQG